MSLFKSYFGGAFNEDAIKNNFVLIYELLDGTLFPSFFDISCYPAVAEVYHV